tara:strand:- start:2540 stop:3223 length:684 start_codon:yes stop_codon:yes gene_type:complete
MTTEQAQAEIFFAHLTSVEEHIAYGDKQFYMSLLWQHENPKSGSLSSSQMMYLERMYNKYSMEEIKKKEEFAKNYSDSHRDVAIKCARYYENQYPPYYDAIVEKVLNDPSGHTLSFNEYNKMCNNKYAKKILACYEEKLKYSVGDFVQIRATNRVDIANTNHEEGHQPRRSVCAIMANKTCMILQVDAKPITRAAKGARLYKILIIDEASPIYAHESDLKKARRPKK